MVKALNGFAFSQVARLWNRSIRTSRWPACVKPSYLSTIRKRGDATELANYRGVCTSSLQMNIPFVWMNALLTPYLAFGTISTPTICPVYMFCHQPSTLPYLLMHGLHYRAAPCIAGSYISSKTPLHLHLRLPLHMLPLTRTLPLQRRELMLTPITWLPPLMPCHYHLHPPHCPLSLWTNLCSTRRATST